MNDDRSLNNCAMNKHVTEKESGTNEHLAQEIGKLSEEFIQNLASIDKKIKHKKKKSKSKKVKLMPKCKKPSKSDKISYMPTKGIEFRGYIPLNSEGNGKMAVVPLQEFSIKRVDVERFKEEYFFKTPNQRLTPKQFLLYKRKMDLSGKYN